MMTTTFIIRDIFPDVAVSSAGVTLENLTHCTKYELNLSLREEDILFSTQREIKKLEPSRYVKPSVTINEGSTNLTCFAR